MDGVPSWAVPGAKVVCIKVGPWTLALGVPREEGAPRFGEVVTIAEVMVHPELGCGLTLCEYHPCAIFGAERFAPIDGDATEAELFRARQYGADAPLTRESEVA